MKKISKLLSVVLALVMVMSLAVFASAEENKPIASLDELVDGTYIMIASNGIAMSKLEGSWIVSEEGNPATNLAWTITRTAGGVKIADCNGTYIAPKGGKNNGITEGEYEWAVSCEDGMFVFAGQGEDTVKLACNTQENKFRAYKNTTVEGNPEGYPYTFALYPVTGGTTPDPEPTPTPAAPFANGDQVKILFPKDGTYVSATANEQGNKLEAADAAGAAVWTIEETANGFYFICDGKYLTSGETGNSLVLADAASDLALWTLEAAENGWFIKNVTAAYNGNPQYMEFYSAFTTYGMNASKADIYTFQFEVVAKNPSNAPSGDAIFAVLAVLAVSGLGLTAVVSKKK